MGRVQIPSRTGRKIERRISIAMERGGTIDEKVGVECYFETWSIKAPQDEVNSYFIRDDYNFGKKFATCPQA